MTRDEAIVLLNLWVENKNLKKHMYAVEAACRFYARKFNQDQEKWGLAGLLHDADWENHPAEHPKVIIAELEKRGVDPEIIHAISCHGNNFGVERKSQLDHILFACDEITGLITTTALVRPGKLEGLQPSSILKKMKDKGFAAGVNRDDVMQGAEGINLSLDEHLANVIQAMYEIREELGL